MDEGNKKKLSTEGKFAAWFGLALTVVVCCGLGIMFVQVGVFESVEVIRGWVDNAGFFGPVLLVLAQVAQVILRFVPGGLTCTAGVVIFGPFWGFVINYIGLLIGCVAVFALVRKYGIRIAEKLAGRENLERYWKWSEGKKFNTIFLVTAILPFFPDDLICVAASLTKISFKRYFLICALGRAPGLILYSLVAAGAFKVFGIEL